MVTLAELLKGVNYNGAENSADLKIGGLTCDSRKVKAGDLFVCMRGDGDDGHAHALEAQMLGAAAIVAEENTESSLPTAIVTNSRQSYSIICQNYFKNPQNELKIVTVVGTNGKTTTCHIAARLLAAAGYKTGIIGTLGYQILEKEYKSDLTTPDSFNFCRILRKMVQAGVEVVLCEASAHAIAQDRLYGIKSDISIFTNVSIDHLDYFGTFQQYSDTKLSFFISGCTRSAIVNSDDALGRRICREAKIPILTYGIDEPSDVFAIDITPKDDGTSFIINLFDEIYDLNSPFYGKHNVYNVLAAVTLAKLLKVPTAIIADILQKMQPVAGRFNVFPYKNAKIIVDFAHTPDGLENLLNAVKSLYPKKTLLVFGCGGDRDKTKRPLMGKIAAEKADVVIITEDNSRSEETEEIIAEIKNGIEKNRNDVYVVPDRKEAVEFAASMLNEGDVLVIAGKGAEEYIERKGVKTRYSDLAEATFLSKGDNKK